jgi:Cu-Zn family superoxide dismutase
MTIAVVGLLALGAGVGLAACGSDSGDGEEAVTGQFELLADAPDGNEAVSGEATLDRTEDGTEASIELSGLKPDTEYVAHVHAAGCDQADPGGPHHKFDPNGSDEPPNEIHFSFTSNAEGSGSAEASNDQRIPDGDAGSIVVHEAEPEEDGEAMEHEGHSHSDKVACAELEGGAASEEAAADGDAMEHEGGEGDAMKHEGGGAETIVVRDGEPVGGVAELTYGAGEQVRFKVSSDVADEVHVHGYDLSKDVDAGGTVSFSFPAEFEGIFEVELEERAEQIAELRVNP